MKTFQAIYTDEEEIMLKSKQDIESLFNCVDKEENFILQCYMRDGNGVEKKELLSKLIIATTTVV